MTKADAYPNCPGTESFGAGVVEGTKARIQRSDASGLRNQLTCPARCAESGRIGGWPNSAVACKLRAPRPAEHWELNLQKQRVQRLQRVQRRLVMVSGRFRPLPCLFATALHAYSEPPAGAAAASTSGADSKTAVADVLVAGDVAADGATDNGAAVGPDQEVDAAATAEVIDALVADAAAEVFVDSAVSADVTAGPETDGSAPATNCATAPEGGACDDGNPCTAATTCAAGACSSGVNLCNCAGDTVTALGTLAGSSGPGFAFLAA